MVEFSIGTIPHIGVVVAFDELCCFRLWCSCGQEPLEDIELNLDGQVADRKGSSLSGVFVSVAVPLGFGVIARVE